MLRSLNISGNISASTLGINLFLHLLATWWLESFPFSTTSPGDLVAWRAFPSQPCLLETWWLGELSLLNHIPWRPGGWRAFPSQPHPLETWWLGELSLLNHVSWRPGGLESFPSSTTSPGDLVAWRAFPSQPCLLEIWWLGELSLWWLGELSLLNNVSFLLLMSSLEFSTQQTLQPSQSTSGGECL